MNLSSVSKTYLDKYHPVIGDELNKLSATVIDNDILLRDSINKLCNIVDSVSQRISLISSERDLTASNSKSIEIINNEIKLLNETISSLSNSYQNIIENNLVSFYDNLKNRIHVIELLIGSNDINLNDLQEIVDFIKMNREMLNSLTISSIAGLQNALDNKVNNNRVLTDVPINAVFTDTIYVLPPASDKLGGVKTGNGLSVALDGTTTIDNDSHRHTFNTIDGLSDALNKKVNVLDYNASDILFKLKTVDTNDSGLNSSTVNGCTVYTDVPVDAVFTDTVYTLPVAGNILGGVKNSSQFNIDADGGIQLAKKIPLNKIESLSDALASKVDNSRVLTDVPLNAKFTDTIYTMWISITKVIFLLKITATAI